MTTLSAYKSGLKGSFWALKFKNHESTEGSDPAMGKESRSKCIPGRQASSNQTVSPNPGVGQLYSKKTISLVWSGVFEQFKNPESTVWCVLALEQGPRSLALPGGQTMAIQRSKDWCFRIFSGGYLFRVFILACCQHNILINHCPPPVLGHHPFLVVIVISRPRSLSII